MKTRSAILRETDAKWEIVDLDTEDPRQDEVIVKLAGCGLCFSELHLVNGGFPSDHYPVCGGHEGAGTIVAVGPNTPGFAEGDAVVLSVLAACGRCRWCGSGQSNLCDLNAALLTGARFDDPKSFQMSLDGEPVAQFVGISCFSEYTTVSTKQIVKISPDISLTAACLIGCGVQTGWGSAVNLARPEPGDVVIVMGTGGVGSFAVQGALHSGATNVIACDPEPFKREYAESLGATHSCAGIDEATEIAKSLTNGQGADATIITVGKLEPEMVAQGLASIRKGGTTVVTSVAPLTELGVPISMADLTLSQKRLQGSMYGGMSAMADVPRLLRLYQQGQLKLDESITKTYSLDEVNEGYADLIAGRNIRGAIVFD